MTTTSPHPGAHTLLEQLLSAGTSQPVSERLIRTLEAHLAAIADNAARASHLANASRDRAVNVLLDLIVEDAHRHQDMLERMIKRLKQALDGTDTPTPLPIPQAGGVFTSAEEAVGNLRAFIRNEQEGARYLRHLGRQDPDLYGGFFALLLETIARDAEKHVHLLRYILRRTETR
jgi:hypothetical protein